MKKNVVRILTAVLMLSVVFSSSVFAAEKQKSAWESFVGLFTGNAVTVADTQVDGVTYRTHIQNDGWKQGWVSDGEMSGSEGRGLRLEGIEIEIEGDELPDGLGITYRTHIENDGWKQGWVSDGEMSGSEGRGLRLEGIEIMLTGENADDYTVLYRTHIQNDGWKQGWVADGEMSGSEGRGLRLEGIEIKIEQVEADLTAYEAALAAVTQADYTAASWTAYQAVVNANVVDEDNLQSEVDAATAAITAAQANLVKVLKVESVSAINAKQVQVKFTSPVAKDSVLATPTATTSLVKSNVLTVAKVSGTGTPITSNSLGAVLSADGLTLTLTATTGEYLAGTYTATLTNAITGTDGQKLVTYSTAFVANDTTAPGITTVEASTAGTTISSVKITFTEPVNAGSIIQVDGTTIGSTATGTETTISNLSLAAGTHTLTVINLTDGANNVTPNASQSFTSVVDVTLPTVTVGQYSDTALALTFSKKMDTTTLVGQANISIAGADLTPYTTTITADPQDSTGTKFVATLSGTNVTNLYLNSTTRNLVATFADGKIKDTLGNKMAGVTVSTTLTKETVAPSITGISYETDTDNKLTNIVLTFNKTLPAQTTANANTFKAIDASGVDKTTSFFSGTVTTTVAGNTIKVPVLNSTTSQAGYYAVGDNLGIVNGVYTFVVPKDFVYDSAQTRNYSNAFSGTIDFGAAKAGSLTVSSVSGGTNIYTLTYSAEPKGGSVTGSATLPTNYLLNGNALPAGAVITKSGVTVTVDLSATTIATSNAGSILTALNVQSIDGTKSLTTGNMTVATVDNVKPVLKSAKLQSNRSLLLTFDESVDVPGASTIADNFLFKADGVVLTDLDGTGAKAANLTAASVPGFPTQLVVTAAAGVLPTASVVTYSNSGDATITVDADGYTALVAKNYVVKVTEVTADVVTKYVVSTDGGNTFGATEYTFGAPPQTIDNGVAITMTQGTLDVVGDTMSFTVTPIFDMNKAVTMTTQTGTSTITDISPLANVMRTGDTVTITQ